MKLFGFIFLAVAALDLAACGGGGQPVAATTPASAAPVLTFTASTAAVNSGGSATLTWSATDATACTASNGWTGTKAASGSQDTGALTAATTFTLSCSGAGGTSPDASVSVNVMPAATLSANPSIVNSGGSSTLTWSSTDATQCTAGDGTSTWTAGNPRPASGTFTTPALTSATTFSLVCSGTAGNSNTATATVTVAAATPAAPTATLSANPISVTSGGSTTLTWGSTNATSCSINGGAINIAGATSGSQVINAVTASTTYTLTCTGPGGSATATPVVIMVTGNVTTQPPAVPVVTLTAAPTSVASGATSTLTWSSTNTPSSCTASGGWSGTKAASGTFTTAALTATTAYSLTCSNAGGTSAPATATVTVTPVPVVTLTAAPTSVASGATSTLTWSSTNTPSSCTASGGWSGTKAASGTFTTAALTATTAYSLTCSNAGGTSAPATATVTVTPVPVVTLTAAPTSVASGATSTLTWSSTNTPSSCTASGGWSGTQAASGTFTTSALTADTTYSLTCSNAGGTSAPATATVTIIPVPVVTLTAAPTTVVSGGTSTLTWSSTNTPSSCTASDGWSGTQAASGTFTTPALTATTSYTLTCSNAGGASTPASASVTVQPASGNSLSPKIAAITLTRTQQYTAALPGGTPSWSVNGVVGGNTTIGTINSTGLYTAGSTPGAYTITATSSTDATQIATGTVAVTDLAGVYSYHNDQSRDGANTQEYAITKANVATGFGKLASCSVDGAVYAQPLWVANLTINGAVHNVLYVATEHDGLFAFDADPVNNSCGAPLWQVNLIDTAHGAASGETTVLNGPGVTPRLIGIGAGDIAPEIGVTGTPVIDPAAKILYVVTKSVNAAETVLYSRLHAIDMTTGAEKTGSPVLITGSYSANGNTVTFDSSAELQRTGLTLANGNVYVGFSSHEDAGTWYGWMMSYRYTGTTLLQTNILNVAPVSARGGIWMSGGAPAADTAGNVYFINGNGVFNAYTGGVDYGNSMMKVDSNLNILGYYTPSTEVANGTADYDLGAGGAAILADLPAGNAVTHAMIFGGKESHLFVVDRDNPGGYDQNGTTRVQDIYFGGHPIPGSNPAANYGSQIFATGALWNNNLYLATAKGLLWSFTLNTATAQFTAGPQSANVYGFPGATPSVSAAGTSNGIVWTLDTGGTYCTRQSSGCAPGTLHAHDADNVATELWNSNGVAADAAGYPIKFNVVTVANGHAYIGTRGNDCSQSCGTGVTPTILGTVDVYGLKP